MGQRTEDALNVVMATEGVLLDPVYAGKAIAAMIEMARSEESNEAGKMLFVHADDNYCPVTLTQI